MNVEDLSQRALDMLPVGVLVRDASGATVYANEECLRLLGRGLSPDADDPGGPVHPAVVAGTDDPYPEHRDPVLRALRGEASRVEDYQVNGPAGRVVVVVSGTPLAGPDGSVTHALATFTELAGSGGADRDITTAEVVLSGLFEQVIHSMALLRADGTLLEANRRPFDYTGWRREDCIGRPFWETPWWGGKASLQARVRASVRKVAAGDAVVEESEYYVAHGPPRMTLRAMSPVRDSEGQVRYILVVSHDITALRRAQHDARRLAAVVEGSIDFVALTDARERVHYLNPAGRKMLGLADSSPLPEGFGELLNEEGRWRLRDEAEPALAQSGTWRGEIQLRHLDTGETIDVFMTAMILPDAPDDAAGVAFICQDLTERRRIEAALAQALRQ